MYRVLAELAAHCVSFEIVAILAELAERAEGTFHARSLPSNGTTLAITAMWTRVDVPAHCREAVEAFLHPHRHERRRIFRQALCHVFVALHALVLYWMVVVLILARAAIDSARPHRMSRKRTGVA